MSKKEASFRSKPWINSKVQNMIKKRDKLLKKCSLAKNNILKEDLYNQYKMLRNSIVHDIKNSKTRYFELYFDENKNNFQNIWKGIKSLISVKDKVYSNLVTLKQGNSLRTDPLDVANIFNKYFVEVGPKLASKIPTSKHHFSKYLKHSLINSIYLSPTDENEIFKIITALNSKKSVGPSSTYLHSER